MELPFSNDAIQDAWFLVKRVDPSPIGAQDDRGPALRSFSEEGYVWAMPADLGSEKECSISRTATLMRCCVVAIGNERFETEDYILEVDNKSITNRPDMWGHRGFAREIAALLDFKLKPEDLFLDPISVKELGDAKEGHTAHCTVKLPHTPAIKRFSALAITHCDYRPSLFWMMHRLLRVDSKPIDAIVDMTNYVMLDTSQPMHAFDAGLHSIPYARSSFCQAR